MAYRYANWRVPAEDLMQEGRIAAWQARQRLEDVRNPAGYVLSAAKYAIVAALFARISDRADRAFLSYDSLSSEHRLLMSRDFAPMLINALCPEPKPRPVPPPAVVTETQLEVLRLMCQGMTNKQAADRLCVTYKAVDRNLWKIYRAWGVNSLIAAYNKAMRLGLIEPPCREKSR